MQKITIEIITDNGENVLQNLLGKDLKGILQGARSKSFDDGSEIELSDNYAPSESFGLYEAIPIILTFVSGVVSQILASWIYDKLKNNDKNAKITYRGYEIPLEDLGNLLEELNKVLNFELTEGKQKKKEKKANKEWPLGTGTSTHH